MGHVVSQRKVDDETIVQVAEESDYGSDLDLDDATVNQLLTQSYTQQRESPVGDVKIEDVEEPVLPQRDEADTQRDTLRLSRIDIKAVLAEVEQIESQSAQVTARSARLRELLGNTACENEGSAPGKVPSWVQDYPSAAVNHNAVGSAVTTVQTGPNPSRTETSPSGEPDVNDTRSPKERYRKHRPLTVTDLVSPAWCELQYWYSLTKYGKIKRTPAMKQGSKIHKKIEEETQVEVRVEIETKEDKLGLRLWNTIQGLRGLRATGLTRELEVFGIVNGDVVVGIIDALSYTCPDEKFEAELLAARDTSRDGIQKTRKEELPTNQRTMSDFFDNSQEQAILNSQAAWSGTPRKRVSCRTIYISDVKTRGVKSLPQGTRMRPTQMQLMLYRRFLNDLAGNEVSSQLVFDRYGIDPYVPFSDTFTANIAGIDFGSSQQSVLEADDQNDELMVSLDPLDEVLAYNTLSLLWGHMIAELRRTITVSPTTSSVSPVLTAEFRTASDGTLIGRRSFAYDSDVLEEYVSSEMAWWRGERPAQGVSIEEAPYKCRSCNFADDCTWRKELDAKSGQKGKLKKQSGLPAQSQN